MNIEDIKKLRALAVAADQPHSGVARDYFRQSVTAPRMLTLLDLAERQLNFFEQRVQPWMLACFGETIAGDQEERNHRFLEEALELVQSTGCTASEAHQLVNYVYGRSVGEPPQEVGGVMMTLAALCLANGLDMHAAAETELARIWTKVAQIRAKQAAKPKHSPLPEPAPQQHAQDGGAESDVFMQKSEISPLSKGDSGGAESSANWNGQAALSDDVIRMLASASGEIDGDEAEWSFTDAALLAFARNLTTRQPAPVAAAVAQGYVLNQESAPTAQQERAWYKDWLAGLDGNITVDQVEFGRRVWAERARRAAEGGA